MMPLYIAGPMTGLPGFNFPEFDRAQADLEELGYAVLNPARHGHSRYGWVWEDYLRQALKDVLNSTGVALLPNWEDSKGARLEFHVATSVGIMAKPLRFWKDRRNT